MELRKKKGEKDSLFTSIASGQGAGLIHNILPAGEVIRDIIREKDAIARFHILGLFVVMLMSGTVAFESLVLGDAASEKIGYAPHRAYQIQSGLANAATALTGFLVYVLGWGRYAEASIVTAMLMFFTFSAINHMPTAVMEGNMKPVNLCVRSWRLY